MIPEQEPTSLTPEQAKDLEDRGSAQIETNDLYNAGTLKNPYSKEPVPPTLESMNNASDHYIERDRLKFDALEAAKQGKLDGITDPTEKAALTERFATEGQKGLESLVESWQKKVTEAPLDVEQLATDVAEVQLGTDARGTVAMQEGIAAAQQGIEGALTPEVPQTVQTPEISQ